MIVAQPGWRVRLSRDEAEIDVAIVAWDEGPDGTFVTYAGEIWALDELRAVGGWEIECAYFEGDVDGDCGVTQ